MIHLACHGTRATNIYMGGDTFFGQKLHVLNPNIVGRNNFAEEASPALLQCKIYMATAVSRSVTRESPSDSLADTMTFTNLTTPQPLVFQAGSLITISCINIY